MYIRHANQIADTDEGIIKIFESINKAKKAMRGTSGRVADDHKMFANMRRSRAPDRKVYISVLVK